MEIRLTKKGEQFSSQVLSPVYDAERKLYLSYLSENGEKMIKGLEGLGDEMEKQYSDDDSKED